MENSEKRKVYQAFAVWDLKKLVNGEITKAEFEKDIADYKKELGLISPAAVMIAKPKGWRQESNRHSLAAKGIKTGKKTLLGKIGAVAIPFARKGAIAAGRFTRDKAIPFAVWEAKEGAKLAKGTGKFLIGNVKDLFSDADRYDYEITRKRRKR
jgi:hypothetical protein